VYGDVGQYLVVDFDFSFVEVVYEFGVVYFFVFGGGVDVDDLEFVYFVLAYLVVVVGVLF